MLTIGYPIKAGRESYYVERTQENYYTESADEGGRWFGKGAKALGLEGAVTTKSFQNLLRGFSPDGRLQLAQNARQPTPKITVSNVHTEEQC